MRAATPSASWIQTAGWEKRPAMKNQQKSALKSATAPKRPAAWPCCLMVMAFSAPAMRLDRAVGGEQSQRAVREEVDEVLQLDGALAEGIEVGDGAQVGDQLAGGALRLRGRPADDPGHEQHHEGDQRRHHLALG